MNARFTFCAIAVFAILPLSCARSQTGNAGPVTVANLIRAESDLYMSDVALKQRGFGRFEPHRELAPIDAQTVIRMNRDTLYSAAVEAFDINEIAARRRSVSRPPLVGAANRRRRARPPESPRGSGRGNDVINCTAIILTRNEEIHIERCIRSLRGVVSEILVVNSFSSDATVRIASGLGAIVRQREFKSHSDQLSWAISQVPNSTEWIMKVDADEALDATLGTELLETIPSLPPQVCGLEFLLRDHFCGQPIRFGGRGRMYLMRMWRRDAALVENRWMDEHIVLTRGETRRSKGGLLHHNEKSISEWTAKHIGYASREAIDVLSRRYGFLAGGDSNAGAPQDFKQRLYYGVGGSVAPLLFFVYRYVIRLGFLDGPRGYLFHFLQGYWYRTLVAAKLLELEGKLEGCTSNEERLQIIRQHTGLAV